ncbi:MAG: hypothetical protein KKE00_05450, partial [Proteobacteria bacterium]|nr:hypothetical protein [Pseudomonadota bacterium]
IQKAAERKCQPQGGSGNPKKSVGHLLKTPQMTYWFMDQHRSWHGVRGCAESLEHQGADITDGGDSLRARGIRTMRKYSWR